MKTSKLNLTPGRLDLRLYRGDDVSFTVSIRKDGTTAVLPTTGWKSEIRTTTGDLLASFAVNTFDAEAGALTFTLPSAIVTALPDRAVWDAQCDTPTVKTWLAGEVLVREQVTL